MRGSVDNAFKGTDALARLVIAIITFQGDTNGAVQPSRSAHLESILSLLVLIVNHNQNMHGVHIHQRVFHRLFSVMLYEYSSARLDETSEHEQMMLAFGNALRSLQPAWFPGFIFGWMSLIVNRVLVRGLLAPANELGRQTYRELIGLSLAYFSEGVRNGLSQSVLGELFKGLVRNMLVITHDYPEFLCDNHSYLCSRIGYELPQIRNLVLTSRPASCQELPDPMTPGLKIERLDEMKKNPEFSADFADTLKNGKLGEAIESALKKNGDIESALKQIMSSLVDNEKSPTKTSPQHSIELLNTVAPFVGQIACASGKFDANAAPSTLLTKLVYALNFEHRYYLVNALMDQIRYPNTHTDYFCKLVLHLWGTGNNLNEVQRDVREVLCRVIFERSTIARPHPWGITILSVELQSNAAYGLWEMASQDPNMQARLQQSIRQGGH